MNTWLREEKMIVPSGRISVVIDTDAKNEVDDQFAIAWALRSPERFQVEAVYAAPFSHSVYQKNLGNSYAGLEEVPEDGMKASYQEICKLFSLLNEPIENRIFYGANRYCTDGPVRSAATDDLIRRGLASTETLYVIAIGAATNIASALMLEPKLTDHIVVIWLGGQPPHFPYSIEFNMMQDINAAQYLFECGVPMVWVPCMGVASQLTVSDADVQEKLQGKSRIATYLSSIVLEQFTDLNKAIKRVEVHRKNNLRGLDSMTEIYLSEFQTHAVSWSRPIWDVATIAFLKNPNWVASSIIPVPKLDKTGMYLHDTTHKFPVRCVHYCHRDLIIGDLFSCLAHD